MTGQLMAWVKRSTSALCLLMALAFLLASSRSEAQYVGQTVNACDTGWVDSSNYIQETVCVSGDASGLYAWQSDDDLGYEYLGGLSTFVVSVTGDMQIFAGGSLIYDSGLGSGWGQVVPQLNLTYTAQGNFDECYDPSGMGDFGNCSWTGLMSGIRVDVMVTGPPSILDPLYQITSIIYAPPGNKSSAGFSSTTTNGTTTTLGHSFTNSSGISFNEGFTWGVGGSYTESFEASQTWTNSNAFTEQFSNATSFTNQSVSTNPNTVNHLQDIFFIWLNPELTFPLMNGVPASYSINTLDSQPIDTVEVTAQTMIANQYGQSTVDPSILNPQTVPSPTGGTPLTLPGLATICQNVNISEYQAGACTLGDQCGCQPSDFAEILQQDPLLYAAGTVSPLQADASGAAACYTPTSTLDCRYIPVRQSQSNPAPQFKTLEGPQCQGCNNPGVQYTQTDSTSDTQTFGFGTSYSVGASFKYGTPVFSLTVTDKLTWANTESTGTQNGTANSMAITLNSSTIGCSENLNIYEDTVYHTFVFQEPTFTPPAINPCP
jgi:hypothetical protein